MFIIPCSHVHHDSDRYCTTCSRPITSRRFIGDYIPGIGHQKQTKKRDFIPLQLHHHHATIICTRLRPRSLDHPSCFYWIPSDQARLNFASRLSAISTMLDKTSNLPYLLQLPQELRDHIYSYTVITNKVIHEYTKELPRLWELRISHLPTTPQLLYVSTLISADYKQFCLDTFFKAKILISTNALTSALPIQLSTGRAKSLLDLCPNLIIQASADWKWWVGFTSASFPLMLEEELLPKLPPKTSIELICRLVGRSIFVPDHLGSPRTEANLRSFFEHTVPLPTNSSSSTTKAEARKSKITKTLILEHEPLSDIFGAGAASGLPGFRDHLNRCGAQLPENDGWNEECEIDLEPILQWILAPPAASTLLSDSGQRFIKGEERATVWSIIGKE